MPERPEFPHLPLLHRRSGRARLTGGGPKDSRVAANERNRVGHSKRLRTDISRITQAWKQAQKERGGQGLPTVGGKVVIVLELPEDVGLSYISKAFGLELVAEFEDGYVLAGAPDLDLAMLEEAISRFETGKKGGASVAKILAVYGPDHPERLSPFVVTFAHRAAQNSREADTSYFGEAGA